MAHLVERLRSKAFQAVVARRARAGDEQLVRLGSDCGGWWVPERFLRAGTVAVCGGVGEDTTFDEALVARGVEVVALDPTPRARSHIEARFAAIPDLAERLRFEAVGVWTEDTTMRFYEPANPALVSHSVVNLQGTSAYFEAPCWSLDTVVERFGLGRIDILKLDIEGAEFAVIEHLLASRLRPEVVCIEIDAPFPARRTLGLLQAFADAGYSFRRAEYWNLLLRRAATTDA